MAEKEWIKFPEYKPPSEGRYPAIVYDTHERSTKVMQLLWINDCFPFIKNRDELFIFYWFNLPSLPDDVISGECFEEVIKAEQKRREEQANWKPPF